MRTTESARRSSKSKKVRHLGLYLSHELYSKVQRLADREHRTISSFIRQVIATMPENEQP